MSEAAVILPAGTPASGAPAITVPPVAPAAASAPAAPPPDPNNPPWLAGRLDEARERERATILKELGITDAKKAKEQLDAARKAEDDAKSIADKLAESAKSLSKVQAQNEQLLAATKEWAARQMLALTAEQQAAVKAIAGDDPGQQLKTIAAFQPTWSAQAAAAAPAPKPPATPASGTAPAHTAPDGTNVSQTNHQAVHAQLLKTNPFAAAQYAQEHIRDVFPDAQ